MCGDKCASESPFWAGELCDLCIDAPDADTSVAKKAAASLVSWIVMQYVPG